MERSSGEEQARASLGTWQETWGGTYVLAVHVVRLQGDEIAVVWHADAMRGYEVRNMNRCRLAIASTFTLGALLAVADEGAAQVGSGDPSSDSYEYVVERARPLALELAGSATGYNNLSVSERTTFEAIMHALEAEGLLRIVKSVAKTWGQGPGRGVDQFRLSVVLVNGAVALLRDQPDFRHSRFGHVKLPDGRVIDPGHWQFLNVDSVRQRRRAGVEQQALLQISWKEENPLVAEIDIDYRRTDDPGHFRPGNSDIRSRTDDGLSHYDLHVQSYGDSLENWWRQP